MPLAPTPGREPLHTRTIEMRGYRRPDGDYDIEGHLTDVKAHPLHPPGRDAPLPAGVPVHDMTVRLVVDDHFVVKDIVAITDAGPYADCPHAGASLRALVGTRIVEGWTMRVRALLGRESCTHLVQLLIPLATAAYQTLAEVRLSRVDEPDVTGRPRKIDSCYAYASHRDLVRLRWPAHYEGAEKG